MPHPHLSPQSFSSKPSSMPSLSRAGLCGHLSVVQQLLSVNASLNSVDADGCTALMASAKEGNADVVKVPAGVRDERGPSNGSRGGLPRADCSPWVDRASIGACRACIRHGKARSRSNVVGHPGSRTGGGVLCPQALMGAGADVFTKDDTVSMGIIMSRLSSVHGSSWHGHHRHGHHHAITMAIIMPSPWPSSPWPS